MGRHVLAACLFLVVTGCHDYGARVPGGKGAVALIADWSSGQVFLAEPESVFPEYADGDAVRVVQPESFRFRVVSDSLCYVTEHDIVFSVEATGEAVHSEPTGVAFTLEERSRESCPGAASGYAAALQCQSFEKKAATALAGAVSESVQLQLVRGGSVVTVRPLDGACVCHAGCGGQDDLSATLRDEACSCTLTPRPEKEPEEETGETAADAGSEVSL